MGQGRKESSAKIVFVDPAKQRHRRRLVVGALILICLSGLLYSLLGMGQEGIASVILPADPPRSSEASSPGEEKSMIHRKEDEERLHASGETCDDALVLVDRSHTLPPDYVPSDLVSLSAYGVPTLGGREMLLRREAAEHLRSLMVDAAADDEDLLVASAFRSYEGQKASYGRLKSIYGRGADAMSATPGHSQHQLGTAVDFTNAAADYQIRRSFARTSTYDWLQAHATEHGFVLAYPHGKNQTGYYFEPWHYRYIGVGNARRLEQSGLTLQGFLVREGVLPDC